MNRNIATGIIVFVLAIFYGRMAGSLPQGLLSDPIGASGFPKLLAYCLMALALALIGQGVLAGIRSKTAGQPVAGGEENKERRILPKAAIMLSMGIIYLAMVPWAGYGLSIALLVFAVALFQREPLTWRPAVVAGASGILFWLFFAYAMRIKMPVGVWVKLLH